MTGKKNMDEIEKVLLGEKKGLSENDIDGDGIPDHVDCAPYSALHHGVVDTIKDKVGALRDKYDELKEKAEEEGEKEREKEAEEIKKKIEELKKERKKYEEERKLEQEKNKLEKEKSKSSKSSKSGSGGSIGEKAKAALDWIAPPLSKKDKEKTKHPFEDTDSYEKQISMNNRRQYDGDVVEVYYDDDRDGWVVSSSGGSSGEKVYVKKTPAKRTARTLARRTGSRYIVRTKDGKIQKEEKYTRGKSKSKGEYKDKRGESNFFEGPTTVEKGVFSIFGEETGDSEDEDDFFDEFS